MAESMHHCLNCNHELKSGFAYCPHCGQETKDSAKSVGHFIHHFASDYFTFDSKILKSFLPLLFKPGFLTKEFFAGRRVRYIPPMRMYLFVSIIFFLVLSWLSPVAAESATTEVFWDDFFGSWLPRLFFILLPLFALLLWALQWRNKQSYVVHFIFSLHYHAFLFLATLVFVLLGEIFSLFEMKYVNNYVSLIFALSFLTYLFIALKQMYGQSASKTLLKFILLCISYGLILAISVTVSLMFYLSNAGEL
ncbi:MAG: DUF3667 domain-containing protein [Cryomorphaceae bacterium]|nr:DUF3667 domain-containing protein [Cryomorphaceae bacterium]